MQPEISVDRVASLQRRSLLENYLSANVLNAHSEFVCTSAHRCRTSAEKPGVEFYEAQGHAIGPSYETRADGVPYRVVVVPMETGETKQRRSVEQRTRDVTDAGLRPFGRRNQHMRGVTFALRLAFGLDVDTDDDLLRLVDGTTTNLFDAYAMTNLLLCSAVVSGGNTSRATSTMRKSCSKHLDRVLDILEPTLVISQGVSLEATLRSTLGATRQIAPHVWSCAAGGRLFTWVALRHPSRGNWSSIKCNYLHTDVVPAIERGRKLALHGV